ncbi:hypothetical protein AAAU98_10650 [Enterocloster citroniae]|uniref:hypothetical protein n=1 Tax=Enterocloster citroniae TaxID=358743 RepID=UPI0032BFFDD7
MEIIKEHRATGLGIPMERRMGNTITPIPMTAPGPKQLQKMMQVTRHSKILVKTALSPLSSTVRLTIDGAIPLSMRIIPNQLPKNMVMIVFPWVSGPDITLVRISAGDITPDSTPIMHHKVPMTSVPKNMFPPFITYKTNPA